METIYNLLKRAEELRRKRETGSITAEDVGGLQYDTLAYVANVEQLQKTLGVRRVYKTIDEMLQNTEPLAENGVPLKFGQLVMVFDEENLDCEENGSIYVYQAPGWKLAARDRWVNSIEGVKAELLARIQGTSEESDALRDSFKSLGNFKPNETTLMDALNGMHGKSSTLGFEGVYRAYNDNDFIEIIVKPMSYAQDVWLQTISGILQPMADGTFTLALKYQIYERIHQNGVWSEWKVVASAKTLDELQKQINENKQTVAELIGEAPETLDTIHEISDWITNDKSGAAAMAAQINENKSNLTKETERATGAEQILSNDIESSNSELVKRIQGTSDASNAMKDPFKFAGNYNTATLDNFRAWLDSLHGTDYTLDNRGVYRVVLNDAVIEIISSPIEYTKERYNQVVKGRVSIESTTGLITSSAEFNLLERTHNIDTGWSAWRVVASADTLETLNNAITAETARAEKAETFLTPVPNTYWELIDVGKESKPNANRQYESIIIPVREGDRIIVTAQGAGYARTWGVLDENKYVLRHSGDTYPLTNEEVIIATGEYYIVVNGKQVLTWDVRITSTAADILQQFIAVEDRATEKGRQLALRDLFIAAGALYNDTTAPITREAPWGESVQHLAGHYYLNGLGDITEEQMTKIYTRKEALRNMKGRGYQSVTSMRTYIPIAYNSNAIQFVYDATSPVYLFASNTALEVLLWSVLKPFSLNPTYEHAVQAKGNCKGMFSGCAALRIIGALTLSDATDVDNMFQGCAALEYVFLRQIKKSVSLSDSPNIAKESVLYMIQNAAPTTAITITLHADAYARLENDAEIVAALKEKNGYIDEEGNEVAGTLPEGASINLVSA